MARAFRPSRSVLFGSPERQAAEDLADFGLNILTTISDEAIEAENNREIANARAAMQAEWNGLKAYMRDNPDKAAQWPEHLQKERDRIYKGVMSGAHQPEAMQRIENDFSVTFTGWQGQIADQASGFAAR